VTKPPAQDPLHGKTLKMIVTELEDRFGWEELGLNSSLKFLRKTPWAREKVEQLYLDSKWPHVMSKDKNN
jgi:uncharacterized protein (DUF2132 family)